MSDFLQLIGLTEQQTVPMLPPVLPPGAVAVNPQNPAQVTIQQPTAGNSGTSAAPAGGSSASSGNSLPGGQTPAEHAINYAAFRLAILVLLGVGAWILLRK